jgi:hypothetical protein
VRGLRRKSAETWAFAGRRKSPNFSQRNRHPIGLSAGYRGEKQAALESKPESKLSQAGSASAVMRVGGPSAASSGWRSVAQMCNGKTSKENPSEIQIGPN